MFHILIQYHSLLLRGFATTIALILIISIIGISVGWTLGIVAARVSPTARYVVKAMRYITKVVPVLVLLFWLHYPLQGLLGVVVNPFWTTVIALSGVNISIIAYSIMTELDLLPKSYAEAGQILGLPRKQIIKHIELPILYRRIIPEILLVQASMLEYTLLASLISVPELFRVTQSINSMIYRPVDLYTLLVLFFALILTPLHWYREKLEKNTIQYD
jgi:His/Glu/Gln/Arg/opine family amino acid ABC transporter permease subunit